MTIEDELVLSIVEPLSYILSLPSNMFFSDLHTFHTLNLCRQLQVILNDESTSFERVVQKNSFANYADKTL